MSRKVETTATRARGDHVHMDSTRNDLKLYRELELWHPDSPGGRVTVRRYWPRYLWTPGPRPNGQPRAFATIGEVRAMYRRRGTTARRP